MTKKENDSTSYEDNLNFIVDNFLQRDNSNSNSNINGNNNSNNHALRRSNVNSRQS